MLKTHKLFLIWQSDKEAQYLTDMLHQGYKLRKARFITQTFEKTQSTDGTIQLDYQTDSDLTDYLAIAKAAGWELLTTYPALQGKWLYLYHPDVQAQLYTDQQSRIDLFTRIRNHWTAFGVLMILLLIGPSFMNQMTLSRSIAPMILIIAYLYNFVNLTYRIHILKNTTKDL
ncbi:DUF2812 domain-containing protein [Lactiplantibacillus mudanjiangensis]|nr:DUF2812 domain-containing protein [Lactiplantibacillus mudanjiangensis]